MNKKRCYHKKTDRIYIYSFSHLFNAKVAVCRQCKKITSTTTAPLKWRNPDSVEAKILVDMALRKT